ncbi:MAG: hypothetical protein JO345_17390 [Streptosporangiaceae bacterium]|nr:hypothetical protein [Streptosporangiaceae bacterium]
MPNLSDLSTDELGTAEAACEVLFDLHQRHEILDGELSVKLDTLLNDIRMTQEDQQKKRRQRVADTAKRTANPNENENEIRQ